MFVCIIGTLKTAFPNFLFPCFEIGTSKNGVKRTSNSSTSPLHSQVSTKVNMYFFAFFFLCLNWSYLSVGFFHVCAVGHAVFI